MKFSWQSSQWNAMPCSLVAAVSCVMYSLWPRAQITASTASAASSKKSRRGARAHLLAMCPVTNGGALPDWDTGKSSKCRQTVLFVGVRQPKLARFGSMAMIPNSLPVVSRSCSFNYSGCHESLSRTTLTTKLGMAFAGYLTCLVAAFQIDESLRPYQL